MGNAAFTKNKLIEVLLLLCYLNRDIKVKGEVTPERILSFYSCYLEVIEDFLKDDLPNDERKAFTEVKEKLGSLLERPPKSISLMYPLSRGYPFEAQVNVFYFMGIFVSAFDRREKRLGNRQK